MPVYLLHGFRWPRPLVRIHIILNDLEDAAAEWLMSPRTSSALRTNLAALHPGIISDIPNLQFVEQYDPADVSADARSQPFAYVADIVSEVRLGVEVDEVRGKGVGNEAWGAMVELRDKLAPGEKIAWWVVVCGDTERTFPGTEEDEEWRRSSASGVDGTLVDGLPREEKKEKRSKFARLFGRGDRELRRQKSNKSLNGHRKSTQDTPPPPLPSGPVKAPERPQTTHRHPQPINTGAPRTGILPSPPPTGELPLRPPSTSHANGHKVQVMADRPTTSGAEKSQQLFQTVDIKGDGKGEVVRPTAA